MGALGIAAPLYGGAVLKILYDVALFGAFRQVRSPEETRAEARGSVRLAPGAVHA